MKRNEHMFVSWKKIAGQRKRERNRERERERDIYILPRSVVIIVVVELAFYLSLCENDLRQMLQNFYISILITSSILKCNMR